MSEEPHTIENFHGVYLLYCTNPLYVGRTYIGYTVDPNRRIKQHNKGKKAGGAWKTSNRGPWTMVMIIHGFPNDITALRFEWAWQHPHRSRRLQHVSKKKRNEKVYDFCLRVLSEMLRAGPWNRLPLTIRWLSTEHAKDFPIDRMPPIHMPICHGPVISKKLASSQQIEHNLQQPDQIFSCYLCRKAIDGKPLKCLNSDCDLVSHVICLSKKFLQAGEYIPIDGECPKCTKNLLWGDIIRKYKGCYENLDISVCVDVADDFYSSDSD